MQYLVSVIDDTPNSATSDEMTDIHAFNEGLQADGHWVFAVGLGAPSTATLRSRNSTARTSRWGSSTVSRMNWSTITPTSRPEPTSCADWVAARSRGRRTTEPSRWRATPPRRPT
jgi:hypothetical protein